MRPAATMAAVMRERASKGTWEGGVKLKRCLKEDLGAGGSFSVEGRQSGFSDEWEESGRSVMVVVVVVVE